MEISCGLMLTVIISFMFLRSSFQEGKKLSTLKRERESSTQSAFTTSKIDKQEKLFPISSVAFHSRHSMFLFCFARALQCWMLLASRPPPPILQHASCLMTSKNISSRTPAPARFSVHSTFFTLKIFLAVSPPTHWRFRAKTSDGHLKNHT